MDAEVDEVAGAPRLAIAIRSGFRSRRAAAAFREACQPAPSERGALVLSRGERSSLDCAPAGRPSGKRPENRHRRLLGHESDSTARSLGMRGSGTASVGVCRSRVRSRTVERAWDVSRFDSAWLSEADVRRFAARLLGRALVFGGREETTNLRAVAGSHRVGRASHARCFVRADDARVRLYRRVARPASRCPRSGSREASSTRERIPSFA
jgi:hypothetical protein